MMNPVKNMIARGSMHGVLGMLAVLAVLAVLVASAGAVFAQPGPSATPAAGPAGSAPAPAGSAAAAPADGAPAAATVTPPAPAPAPAPPMAPAAAAADARKACTTAMNADPQFAADIIATLHDKDTVKVHTDAVAHVQKNEQHVIYAYAAMWIIAALFVIFLWRRQQSLQVEIVNLRRDLEVAGGTQAAAKARS